MLVTASDDDDRLTEQELLSSLFQLIVAGHETTTSLIGNGVVDLLEHPDQLRLLRAEPDRMPAAVEELIRFTAPAPHATFRVTTDAMDLAGVDLPAHEQVLICLGAANRDPDVYDDPAVLDIGREPRPHLGFGHGIHFCLGAPLARLEARIAFSELLSRFPDLELAVDRHELRWTQGDGLVLRGLDELPGSSRPIGPSGVGPRTRVGSDHGRPEAPIDSAAAPISIEVGQLGVTAGDPVAEARCDQAGDAARPPTRLGHPTACTIAPTIGPPIGVDPISTTLWSASTRPRFSASALNWRLAVLEVMNAVIPRPISSANGNATGRSGASASIRVATPSSVAARTVCASRSVVWRAIHSAPRTEPMLSTENSNVNAVSVLSNVRVTSNGITTWKLRVNVPMTAVITIGNHSWGRPPT